MSLRRVLCLFRLLCQTGLKTTTTLVYFPFISSRLFFGRTFNAPDSIEKMFFAHLADVYTPLLLRLVLHFFVALCGVHASQLRAYWAFCIRYLFVCRTTVPSPTRSSRYHFFAEQSICVHREMMTPHIKVCCLSSLFLPPSFPRLFGRSLHFVVLAACLGVIVYRFHASPISPQHRLFLIFSYQYSSSPSSLCYTLTYYNMYLWIEQSMTKDARAYCKLFARLFLSTSNGLLFSCASHIVLPYFSSNICRLLRFHNVVHSKQMGKNGDLQKRRAHWAKTITQNNMESDGTL